MSPTAYAQATAGYSWVAGPFAQAEIGARVRQGVSVFGFGAWDKTEPRLGVGARWEWP